MGVASGSGWNVWVWLVVVVVRRYRTFGYLCGNIIYANYASSCEGA